VDHRGQRVLVDDHVDHRGQAAGERPLDRGKDLRRLFDPLPERSEHARESGEIDPPSRCPGPDTVVINAETSRLIRQSLDQLEDPCREIIELRYYGELSYGEIAAELRLNPKTVSSRLSKCLDRLCVIAKKIFPSEHLFTV